MAKAKKLSLAEAVKLLAPSTTGQRTYRSKLSEEQRIEFDKLINWIRESPAHKRPKFADVAELVGKEFGCKIHENTIRTYVNAK